ncbi:ABC transporter ATP-binding protein [Microvirga sp. VF16]|uniref:ABC transporter ATP-binding protein n=1 Tax=Microvirga sp. VF16 TaxID=2807101 RepID=UPI00193E04B4|nr:ABC transporter ATP-binding protein [Microvirga sp. VF16]QRM32281.1 ABC transporter ATP-binding protein [Microvirga sp. VF16]
MSENFSAGTPLLEIAGLRVEVMAEQGWREVVHGVDLILRRGEVLGLIGESGAGKSTIGLAALGFARNGSRFSAGSIRLDGEELIGASERRLRALRGARVAYVAQSAAASFNPAHNLIDQYAEIPVAQGLKTRRQAEADAREIYGTLSLPDPDGIGYRYPHQVSGGQLQRAMIAMAMACQPELIVFDEPTTALDVTTQVEVLTAIKVIVEKFGTAALYITHDLAVVAQMADRIMVLRNGRKVEEGETRRLLAAPREPYTKDLLGLRAPSRKAIPPIADEEPLLRIENVSAAYGNCKVLHDVSVSVGRKRTIAVVGESGSGKSTLARVITGLLPPSQGRIVFDRKPLPPLARRRSRSQLKRIQMINQSPDIALNPRQRVDEILSRPLEFYLGLRGKERQKRINDLLRMIELDESYALRLPDELSGGEKQRVCIARALAAEPELIICDEVTSALDQLVAQEILRLLQRLQDELSVSFLFITHDLITVKAIADEIVVMQGGRVIEQGDRETVLAPPHHPYTNLLLSSVPQMDPNWLTQLLANRGSASD